MGEILYRFGEVKRAAQRVPVQHAHNVSRVDMGNTRMEEGLSLQGNEVTNYATAASLAAIWHDRIMKAELVAGLSLLAAGVAVENKAGKIGSLTAGTVFLADAGRNYLERTVMNVFARVAKDQRVLTKESFRGDPVLRLFLD